MYDTFTKNYREFQDLCDEVTAGLPVTGRIAALKLHQESDSAAAAFATGSNHVPRPAWHSAPPRRSCFATLK